MEFLGKIHPEWNGILGNCVNVIGITYLLNLSVIIFPPDTLFESCLLYCWTKTSVSLCHHVWKKWWNMKNVHKEMMSAQCWHHFFVNQHESCTLLCNLLKHKIDAVKIRCCQGHFTQFFGFHQGFDLTCVCVLSFIIWSTGLLLALYPTQGFFVFSVPPPACLFVLKPKSRMTYANVCIYIWVY